MIFGYIQGWLMSGISMKVTYNLRKQIMEKIHKMPLKYFDGTNHGEILSRITNDVDTITQTLNQSLSQIITSITMIIGVIGMMLSISWQMTLIALIVLPISAGLMMFIIKHSQKYFKKRQEYLGM
nr:ABC transporter transmembrane domain-containing protein [Marinitoga lauensis]